jgi:Alpha galactosidase A
MQQQQQQYYTRRNHDDDPRSQIKRQEPRHSLSRISTSLRLSSSSFLLLVLLLVSGVRHVSVVVMALDNGLGIVPPMGWNSWNEFHCNVSEELILSTADRIVALGLDQVGYRYVNIDDCWMAHQRTTKDDTGELVGNAKTFPHGMKYIGDYLHNRSLLFGIYSSAGIYTCAGFPASLGHEAVDAQTFANWGVDYLKYDNCHVVPNNIPSIDRYTTMRDALNATGRPIFYSLCQWGTEQSWQWAPAVGNSWRTTADIEPDWETIKSRFWVRASSWDSGITRRSKSHGIPFNINQYLFPLFSLLLYNNIYRNHSVIWNVVDPGHGWIPTCSKLAMGA